MSQKIFIIGGTSGDYEDISWWQVEAWTNKQSAETRMLQMQIVANEYSSARREHGATCPDLNDDTEESNEKFQRWLKKCERMERAARRETDDPNLVLDTTYFITPLKVIA